MDYTPKIKKAELVHGAYYRGRCRNATIARWNGQAQFFVHWRAKYGMRYLETIHCPEDDDHYDVFIAHEVLAPENVPEDQKINLEANY